MEPGTIAVIDAVRLIAGKLIEGLGWGEKVVSQALKTSIAKSRSVFVERIEKLGKKMRPVQSP